MEEKTTSWLLGFLLGFSIFFVYVLPHRDMRLFEDDYGVAYFGSMSTDSNHGCCREVGAEGWVILPSNINDGMRRPSFFDAFRPFSRLFYRFWTTLFGSWQHGYFLASVLLHAAATMMLFYACTLFLPSIYALLTALLFGFYPCMVFFVGRFSVSPYSWCLICLVLSLLLLRRHIMQRSWLSYGLSVLLFAVAVGTREAVVVLPIWLLVAVPWFMRSQEHEVHWFRRSLSVTMPYLLVVAIYVVARWYFFPILLDGEYLVLRPIGLLSRFGERLFNFVTMVVDTLGLSLVPDGNRLRKGILVLGVMTWLSMLFMRSQRKWLIIILVFGYCLFAWPSIVVNHQARYLYFAVPFLFVAGAVAIQSLQPAMSRIDRALSYLSFMIIALFIVSGIIGSISRLSARAARFRAVDDCYRQLVAKPDIKDRAICFVGVPQDWFPMECIAQTIWLLRGSASRPVFYDKLMNVACCEFGNTQGACLPPATDLVSVAVKGDTVHIVSKDHTRAWIPIADAFGRSRTCTMGTLKLSEVSGSRGYDLRITIDDRWLRTDPVFVTWNFEQRKFSVYATAARVD